MFVSAGNTGGYMAIAMFRLRMRACIGPRSPRWPAATGDGHPRRRRQC